MLSFSFPTLRDRAAAEPILRAAACPGTDYNFLTLYLWAPGYGGVCITDSFVTQRIEDGDRLFYLYPACLRDEKRAVDAIMDDCRARGARLCFFGLTAQSRDALESLYPGRFAFSSDRDHSDYLYEIGAFCTLAGRKLQSRRNFCNRFEREHPGWRTVPITAEVLPLCRKICDGWDAQHEAAGTALLERDALALLFDSYESLGAQGLLLLDGENPLAFSVASASTPTVFDVHFEKALPDVPGAYAMISREFARHIARSCPGVRYLNREDDMGEPNLRRAKLACQPALILEKFIAEDREVSPCDFGN